MEKIDKVLSNLGTILRYLASGFVAAFVTIWVDKCFDPLKLAGNSGYPSWAVPVGAGLVGIFVYAVHKGVVARLLWALVVWSHNRAPLNRLSKLELLKKVLGEKVPQRTWAMMWDLDSQRWKRRASSDDEVKSVQRELDTWSELLNFLYCSAYITIVVPILVRILHTAQAKEYWWTVSCFGCLIMVFALISDWRESNREFWACDEYPDGTRKSGA